VTRARSCLLLYIFVGVSFIFSSWSETYHTLHIRCTACQCSISIALATL
jgi:hypothetical protein